jgi:hypothetical protein
VFESDRGIFSRMAVEPTDPRIESPRPSRHFIDKPATQHERQQFAAR